MTWHFTVAKTDTGPELRVWDHTADPSTDPPTHTRGLSPNLSERSLADVEHVRDLMAADYRAQVTPGNAPVHNQRAVEIQTHRIRDDIERVE